MSIAQEDDSPPPCEFRSPVIEPLGLFVSMRGSGQEGPAQTRGDPALGRNGGKLGRTLEMVITPEGKQ